MKILQNIIISFLVFPTLPAGQQIPHQFIDSPREFSVMPFWFWNDTLKTGEILRQIRDFDEHGVYGFVIHPRMGLPSNMRFLSPEMLDFMKVAIEEAARRNMKVILYDEGLHPSGSCEGQVVARFNERPPDVGPNAKWWNNYKPFATACSRLSWLNTDSRQVCEIAILGDANWLPDKSAKVFFQNQRHFNYLELNHLKMMYILIIRVFISPG